MKGPFGNSWMIFVATDVSVLFRKSVKIATCSKRARGSTAFLTMLKNCNIGACCLPLVSLKNRLTKMPWGLKVMDEKEQEEVVDKVT